VRLRHTGTKQTERGCYLVAIRGHSVVNILFKVTCLFVKSVN